MSIQFVLPSLFPYGVPGKLVSIKLKKVPCDWSATTLRHTPRHTPHIIFNRPSMVPAVNISNVRVSRMQLSYRKRSTEEGRAIKYQTDTDALAVLTKPKGLKFDLPRSLPNTYHSSLYVQTISKLISNQATL